MAYEYQNDKKQTYFIHERRSTSGKLSFTCNQHKDGGLDAVPEGYEIYEHPNGQVFCRKIQKQIITDDEVQIAKDVIKKHCDIPHVKVDVKRAVISIWTSRSVIGSIYANFSSSLRFTLEDKKQRTFYAERYCYLGGIDDWIVLYEIGNGSLKEVMEKTVVHLGKESMYELM